MLRQITRLARDDDAAVEQQAAVAVLGQAGQRIQAGDADAGPLQRFDQRVAQPLAQLVEGHPAGRGGVAAVGSRCAGEAVRPHIAGRQPGDDAATAPDRPESAQHLAQHRRGRELGAAAGGEAIEEQARAHLQAAAAGLGRQRLAEPAEQPGAALQADHRVARAGLEHVAQHAGVDALQRGAVGTQRVGGVVRKDAADEGAEARHAQTF